MFSSVRSRALGLAIAVVGAGLIATPVTYAATVTAQNGTGNFGTVTVTQAANELDFSINVSPNNLIHTSNGNGIEASFAFTTDKAVTFSSPITSNNGTTYTTLGNGLSSNNIHMDGAGFFGGGITFSGNGGSNPGGT